MSPERALGKSIDNNVEKIQGNDNIFDYFAKEAEIFGYKIFGADNKLLGRRWYRKYLRQFWRLFKMLD